ncbi:MAG TPA: type II secretion system F family protein [Acidimicrobiia bacterium]|nr:type II secretion system F family protein [Acidimicrobiia bacterium]
MPLPLIIAACLAGSVLLGGFLTMGVAAERSDVRESLRRLEGYQIQDVRDQEMLAPISERVVNPIVDAFGNIAQRFTPQGYRDQVARKLVLGGLAQKLSVDQVLVWKLCGMMSGLLWLPLVLFVLRLNGIIAFAFVVVLWGVSFMLPDVHLSRAIDTRRHDIAVQLPDILDLLVISVEAGLGFEQALERTTSAVPGPLSDEFRRMLRETSFGSSRADALRSMDERCDVPELRTFVVAMLQADTFGVSIVRILRSQADEMRVRRKLRAQQQAQKLPVKMLFPLVFCIFPSIFVVILGPAMIQLSHTLGHVQ